MRLIYAELAKAQFTGNFTPTYTTAEAHAFIDSVPTVDVQPVVHSRWEISSDGYYPYARVSGLCVVDYQLIIY